MNRSRILAGLAASVGFSVAVACGSSSSHNGAGNGSGNDAGSTGTSSGSPGPGSGDDAGGTGCASGQALCLGLTNSCVTPGQMCFGTMVLANECSATSACPSGQVCCSSYVGADGGVILLSDAGAGDAGTGASALDFASLGSVAVQCMTQCPSNALSSQVCALEDDGGSPTACPEGTTCRDYLPTPISSVLPNTLCLAPLPTYDGGTAAPPGTDGGAGTGASDGAASVADAASGTDAAPE